jgi:uncharacterized membrane protein YkvA (DUF1232 family)
MSSTDISEIQRQMALIRNEMHQEVQDAVRTAQYLTDWQAAVKNHPWVSLSVASIAGYLLVPKRHSQTPTIVAMGSPSTFAMPATAYRDPAPEPKKSNWRILGTAVGLLAPIAIRVGQNYALRHLEEWLAQHPLSPASGGSPASPGQKHGQTNFANPASRLREYG